MKIYLYVYICMSVRFCDDMCDVTLFPLDGSI